MRQDVKHTPIGCDKKQNMPHQNLAARSQPSGRTDNIAGFCYYQRSRKIRSNMILKKTSAAAGLLSSFGLLIHVIYNIYAYLTFYYNPSLKKLTAIPFILFTCIHAVCGMCSVFLLGDGTRLDIYRKQNMQTVIQRVSAALIFPLLILHLKTFDLLKTSAGNKQWLLYALLTFLQVIFYAVTAAHVSVSFSRALITLGILTDRQKQKKLDRFVHAFCVVLFAAAVFAVVRGQQKMILPK